jgi:RNA polymerase sigma factor (TIGR02999 family)
MAPPDSPSEGGEVTRLLIALRHASGNREVVFEQLFELVYAELRRVAEQLLQREQVGHTLQATALVHEAYFKLAGGRAPDAQDRTHFIGVAARAMRQVLVDQARRRQAAKRGHGEVFVTLGEIHAEADQGSDAETLLALDEAMQRLAALEPRLAKVVELRFFGGLAERDIAALLDVTPRTVQRDWAKARAWLHVQVAGLQ